jgi:hypothetical protein
VLDDLKVVVAQVHPVADGLSDVVPLRWGAAAAAGTARTGRRPDPHSAALAPLPHPSLQGVRSFVHSKLLYELLLVEHSFCSIIFRFLFSVSFMV